MSPMKIARNWNEFGSGRLPQLLGVEILEVNAKRVQSRMEIRPELLAPNGYLHAGSVITLADTACGYGTVANLPDGGIGFTTVELKANFIGTVREGAIKCEATLAHGGRSTQVWDAQVLDEATNKLIALFRCTQMILYPRKEGG
jgi:1,4-dihydroxy-2-naphthoyl-CoA hydrolase